MKRKEKLFFLVLLCVIGLYPSLVNGLPVTGALTGWEPDSVSFYTESNGRTLSGQIDYAVYEYDDYPGTAPAEGQYVYVYQIFNSEQSSVGIDYFSAGILGDVVSGGIGYDFYGAGDGVMPNVLYFSPNLENVQSAVYLFLPPFGGFIESGQHSVLLLYVSDNEPIDDGFSVIAGGSISATAEGLPTPVPEPATIVLLGIGGALLALTRKR